MARTERVCCPSGRLSTANGDVHAPNDPASSLHSNVEFASDEVNANDGGPIVIVVSGGVVSTVNVRVAGVESTFPAASIARTENVGRPSDRRAVQATRIP